MDNSLATKRAKMTEALCSIVAFERTCSMLQLSNELLKRHTIENPNRPMVDQSIDTSVIDVNATLVSVARDMMETAIKNLVQKAYPEPVSTPVVTSEIVGKVPDPDNRPVAPP